jgi:hypothetical protein
MYIAFMIWAIISTVIFIEMLNYIPLTSLCVISLLYISSKDRLTGSLCQLQTVKIFTTDFCYTPTDRGNHKPIF